MGLLTWRPEYDIGVEALDNEHKALFLMLEKLSYLVRSDNYSEHVDEIIEQINIAKSDLASHFSHEEEYMASINYKGFEIHKRNHDNLLNVTIPSIEIDVINSKYAQSEVTILGSVVIGWLVGHVLVDDHAITGRAVSRYTVDKELNFVTLLQTELNTFMKELANLPVSIVDANYEVAPIEDGYYYLVTYEDGTEVVLGASLNVIFKLCSSMLGRACDNMDKGTSVTYNQITNNIANAVLATVHPDSDFIIMSHRELEEHMFIRDFTANPPDISMLWESEAGPLALFVRNPLY